MRTWSWCSEAGISFRASCPGIKARVCCTSERDRLNLWGSAGSLYICNVAREVIQPVVMLYTTYLPDVSTPWTVVTASPQVSIKLPEVCQLWLVGPTPTDLTATADVLFLPASENGERTSWPWHISHEADVSVNARIGWKFKGCFLPFFLRTILSN